MPPYTSAPDDVVLHGPRVLGFASSSRVADRFGLDAGFVDERLRGYEARGWVRHSSFAFSSGWSVTDDGRVENERRLAIEVDRAGARDAVTSAHAEFVPLNRRFGAACTDWQIRPTRADPMASTITTIGVGTNASCVRWRRWTGRFAMCAPGLRSACSASTATPTDIRPRWPRSRPGGGAG